MRRPIYVTQRENDQGDFWYTARAGNAENILTSKMYDERWRATRAARAFIKSIAPAPVTFTYWKAAHRGHGDTRTVTERIR